MSSRCRHLALRRKWRTLSALGSGCLFFFFKVIPLTSASSPKEICHLLFLVKCKRVCTELFSCLLNSCRGLSSPFLLRTKLSPRLSHWTPRRALAPSPCPPAPFSSHTTCLSHSAFSQVCRPPVLPKQSFCHLIFWERFFKIQIPPGSLHSGSVRGSPSPSEYNPPPSI